MPKRFLNILVVEAQTIGSLAVIRSLGRAGHQIHAASYIEDAIGFKSNFVHFKVRAPVYDKSYHKWLEKYILDHEINLIIPSESLLLAIEKQYDDFKKYLPIQCSKKTAYKGMCKWDLFELLKDQSHLPKHLLIQKNMPKKSDFDDLTAPYFIKLDQFHQKKETNLPAIIKCDTIDKALTSIKESLHAYDKILVQEFAKGIGCGVFFLIWDDKIIAQFMHKRIHEVPHTGGASSLRKSWWHEGILKDAKKKVQTLGWQGVVMIEYRWNPENDEFQLMEMNCRFWGSLHLALHADVDFPALLAECFDGNNPQPVLEYPKNILCRLTFPKEVQYVWSRIKDKNVSFLDTVKSIIEFFILSLNPKIKTDFSFPKDRKLYWIRLKVFLKTGN